MTLKELDIGSSAVITSVGGEGSLRQHFLDMGVIPGAEVTLMKYAPMGDPMELRIHGYELTLRIADAEKIEIIPCDKPENSGKDRKKSSGNTTAEPCAHPGLGEGGKYHTKADENPLPKGTVLTFALAGNQNCGKTTLFNQLTGSNQACRKFSGRNSRPQERTDKRVSGYAGDRSSGNIFALSVYKRGDRFTAVYNR